MKARVANRHQSPVSAELDCREMVKSAKCDHMCGCGTRALEACALRLAMTNGIRMVSHWQQSADLDVRNL
jgi:hypothetical protein